ncbi:hypothetical protein WS75_04330 [Burkholderia sp. FL-7-2-10-S1-D7]|nr:hypothetical protein WS75_04330 [Burkholderia sp. FL-7-2-10-S1-D7]
MQHRACGRQKSNDATYHRPFGRLVARAARPAGARVAARTALPCFGAPASTRRASSHTGRTSHPAARADRAIPFSDTNTVARMRRLPHPVFDRASHPAPCRATRANLPRPATLAERVRAA